VKIAETRQTLYKHYNSLEAMDTTPRINQIFSLVLKVCGEFDDITSAGRLFYVRAEATGNDRSPTVYSRVDGTSPLCRNSQRSLTN